MPSFDGIAQSMRAAGAPDHIIAKQREAWQAQRATQPDPHIHVFPENIPAFLVLNATADQWEYPGAFGGGRLALPLTEIRACMAGLQIEDTAEQFTRVLSVVRAAREVKLAEFERSLSSR